MSAFVAQLQADLRRQWRSPGDVLHASGFFVLVLSLFPLAVSPEPSQLAAIASGIVWVAALLAVLLGSENLFRRDIDNGMLEQWLVSPSSLLLLSTARLLSHWLLTGLPLVLLSPLLCYMLHLPMTAVPVLMLSLLLGTPVLTLVAGIGAALLVGARKGGALLMLVVLPLYVPVLILGTLAVQATQAGMSAQAYLMLMSSLLILAITLAPFAVASALRVAFDG